MTSPSVFLVFLLALFASSRSFSDNEYDPQLVRKLAPLKEGFVEFFKTGVATDDFEKLLEKYPFPHVFSEGTEDLYDNPTTCYLCNLVVDLVIGERWLGLSRESLFDEVFLICKDMKIENERVCRGAINQFIDVFLYIIDNYQNLTSNRVCGLLLQPSGCPTGDAYEWTIDIASGNSVDRATLNDTSTESFKILQFSDIHYDPLYLPGGNAKCGEPVCCQSDQEEPASPEDACGYWTDYRDADSPWHLVEESIRQAKTQDFDYVYYTGDIIAHRVWETSIDTNTEAITKLLTYFKDQFEVPVFPVFGNHEPTPVNLWATDNVDDSFNVKWLFQLVATLWSDLIGEDISETVLKGGYYSVSPRPGFRVIGINSNLGYTNNWWLIYKDIDPFNQLQWLADELKAAEDNDESVHILSHVPTGSPSSLKIWNREFGRIVERFAHTITGHFNGHTHKDEFHVFYNTSEPTQAIGVAFNGASVTPYTNSNPSFKYYNVDATTFNLLDYEEWYFNLTLANSAGEGEPVEWKKLYSFVEAYGSQNLLPEEVDKVLHKMTEDHTLLDDYFLFKYRNGDAGIRDGCDDGCKKNLLCNIVTTLYGNNDTCNRFLELYDQ